MIGIVSLSNAFDWRSNPDILHLYNLKSSGHLTMSFSIVNLNCGVLFVLIEPEAVAPLLYNVESAHKSLFSLATETTVVKLPLAFFESWMKNKEASCEGLVMEQRTTKSFSRRVTVCGMAWIWTFWDEAETIDNQNESTSDMNIWHNILDNNKRIGHSFRSKNTWNYRPKIWTRFSRLIIKVKFTCKNFTPFFIYIVPDVNDRLYQGKNQLIWYLLCK